MDELKNELEELQRDLATIDLHSSSKGLLLEALMLKFQNIKIKIYQEKGHKLPHIHIDYGKEIHAASYAISNTERIKGTLDKKYDKSIKKWLEKNKEKLLTIWNKIQAGEEFSEYVAQLSGSL